MEVQVLYIFWIQLAHPLERNLKILYTVLTQGLGMRNCLDFFFISLIPECDFNLK